MEEFVHVLDTSTSGAVGGRGSRSESLVYAVGESEFRLFELVAKPNVLINIGDRLYIGQDAAKRDRIDHVKRRIRVDDLSSFALQELEYAVADIVVANEPKYVNFYNKAEGLSLKKHSLEELPKLGKKTMQAILDERKKGDFKSFADMAERIAGFKKPEQYIVKRIVLEITDDERKHYLFVPKDTPRDGGMRRRP